MDRFGRGSYLWTANPESPEALVRVTANQGTQPQDASDTSFLITNGGTQYYVNDGSLVGDVFTTAIGDNANSGKTPDRPMWSLAALLSAYDLDAGDVIQVDSSIPVSECHARGGALAQLLFVAFEVILEVDQVRDRPAVIRSGLAATGWRGGIELWGSGVHGLEFLLRY